MMATKAWISKSQRKPKYMTRTVRRCRLCGRRRGFIRDFGVCRLCFRELAHRGLIPGVMKASW
jgi:small subunit ribosomal protein S14